MEEALNSYSVPEELNEKPPSILTSSVTKAAM